MGHFIGVAFKADDGESGPKQLFLLVVGETDLVPELEESSLSISTFAVYPKQ